MTHNANELAHEAKDYSYLNVILVLSWVIFFLPYYVISGVKLLIDPSSIPEPWNPLLLPIGMWVFFLSWVVFNKTIVYVLVSLIVIISGIAAFIWGHKGRLARLCALLGALSVIGLPWVFPYEPALHAAPGVTMQVVTQPANPALGFVQIAQSISEEVPCEYDLLGWSAENQLYYHSQCGAEEQIWLVDPNQPDNAMPKTDLPNDLPQKAKKQEGGRRTKEQEALRQEVLEMVRADGVSPKSAERATRETYLRFSLRSPNGQWIAIKSEYVYGAQDVLLIKAQ